MFLGVGSMGRRDMRTRETPMLFYTITTECEVLRARLTHDIKCHWARGSGTLFSSSSVFLFFSLLPFVTLFKSPPWCSAGVNDTLFFLLPAREL